LCNLSWNYALVVLNREIKISFGDEFKKLIELFSFVSDDIAVFNYQIIPIFKLLFGFFATVSLAISKKRVSLSQSFDVSNYSYL